MRFVKIFHHRGYGDCVWEIISEHGSDSRTEYELKNKAGEKVRIYKAHCYSPTVSEIRAAYGWPPSNKRN